MPVCMTCGVPAAECECVYIGRRPDPDEYDDEDDLDMIDNDAPAPASPKPKKPKKNPAASRPDSAATATKREDQQTRLTPRTMQPTSNTDDDDLADELLDLIGNELDDEPDLLPLPTVNGHETRGYRGLRAGLEDPDAEDVDPDETEPEEFVEPLTDHEDAQRAAEMGRRDSREGGRRTSDDEDVYARERENRRRLGIAGPSASSTRNALGGDDPLHIPTLNERYGDRFAEGDRVWFATKAGDRTDGEIVAVDHADHTARVRPDGEDWVVTVDLAKLKMAHEPGDYSTNDRKRWPTRKARPTVNATAPTSHSARSVDFGDDALPIPSL